MSTIDLVALNHKRGNIKSQITKINKTLAENQDSMDAAELQIQLDILVKLQEKFKSLKDEYFRIPEEKEFEEAETVLTQMEDDLKIVVSLKTSINKIK